MFICKNMIIIVRVWVISGSTKHCHTHLELSAQPTMFSVLKRKILLL